MKLALKSCAAVAIGTAMAVTAPASAQVVGTPGAPSGFGLAGGNASLSLSGSYGPPRGVGLTRFDASSSFAVGFGDPAAGLGIQVGANLTSFRRFGKSGYFTMGVHKMFQTSEAGIYSVGVNLENIAPWGDVKGAKLSGNIVGSYMTSFGDKLGLVTVGVTNSTAARKVTGIFAIGMGLTDATSVSFAQVGNRSTVGLTVVPAQNYLVNVAVARDWKTKDSYFTVDLSTSFNLLGK